MLNPSQLTRYSRNLALSEIGQNGQEALLEAKVLIIGAGGLGSPVALYLAAAGVGVLGILDNDRIELSNLQRQILYNENSIGKEKSFQASQKINQLNKDITLVTYNERLTNENAIGIIRDFDIIADCSDNFETRFIVNDTCFDFKKILVSGAVTGFTGQVSTFKSHLGKDYPCYRCFCPSEPPEDILPNCSSGGVLGSICGVVGSIQATETIKEILHIGDSLSGRILIYDGLKGNFRKTRLNKNKNCTTCSANL